jgi:hypothetical protein
MSAPTALDKKDRGVDRLKGFPELPHQIFQFDCLAPAGAQVGEALFGNIDIL